MAATEVEDLIYREWVLQVLGGYAKVGGDHYRWSMKFVEAVCDKEDRASQRLDWSKILQEVRDGLVI
ncbi:hypothetical protein N7532_004765 [Penicillium argentinense]|uniref:Uncharacterized protein n=1 Tax=Penicillium argentinense TaxID=1131581 RepID=A0A9W9KFU6_9EURO|nr:uncharacterized protein N7532_004765 [Penicillium argentinense]KAJ5104236.1 hypothetical protein N7532_004765 [Penicillium argentinense]